MLTKSEVERLLNQKISKEKEEIYRKMAQAFTDNNMKLFNELVMKSYANEHYVTREQLDQKWDTIMTTLDRTYGIVKKMDEEQTVMSYRVNNHESRLTKIETAIA